MKRLCEEHERIHISDCDNASSVCEGKEPGVQVDFENREDAKKSECKAAVLELRLLNAYLNTDKCSGEECDLAKNKKDLEDYIKKNGCTGVGL